MTFLPIQDNIAKQFSSQKKLYFNTRDSSLYFNKTDLLPNQKRNLQKLKKCFHDMADDYHNNDALEAKVAAAIQKKSDGGTKCNDTATKKRNNSNKSNKRRRTTTKFFSFF